MQKRKWKLCKISNKNTLNDNKRSFVQNLSKSSPTFFSSTDLQQKTQDFIKQTTLLSKKLSLSLLSLLF